MQKLILLFLLLPVFALAQTVNIPDANFKATLVGNTAINTNLDGEIQVSEATAFSGKIDVAVDGISDLTGIEAFVNITQLNCSYNTLFSLDVSNNIALTSLTCSNNWFTSLDVSKNVSMVTLTCSNNPSLTSLTVAGATALKTLNLQNNNSLKSLVLSGVPALENLNCYGGPYNTIDVSAVPSLTSLVCYGNPIGSLDVSSNVALSTLDCGNTGLTSLDVSSNLSLVDLSCDNNSLTSLDVSKNTALGQLDCRSNLLTSLDVSNNVGLSYFLCYDNSLTSLDVSNNPVLSFFSCSDNSLTSLNVNNGINAGDSSAYIFTGNSALFCISINDVAWANANLSTNKDSWATYSNDCTVGIEDSEINPSTITSHNKTISIKGKGTASIYNLTGQRVRQTKLTGNTLISLDKGIYLVRVTNGGRSFTEKVYLH